MLVRKCDKCGAVYEDSDRPDVSTAVVFVRMRHCSNLTFDFDCGEDIWQLCPKCIGEIQNYLKDTSLSV